MKHTSDEASTDQLMKDFKALIADAEALLDATADEANGKLGDLRTRAETSVNRAKARMADMQEGLVSQTRKAAEATDAYVHENPWTSIGLAAGLGLLVGLLNRGD